MKAVTTSLTYLTPQTYTKDLLVDVPVSIKSNYEIHLNLNNSFQSTILIIPFGLCNLLNKILDSFWLVIGVGCFCSGPVGPIGSVDPVCTVCASDTYGTVCPYDSSSLVRNGTERMKY